MGNLQLPPRQMRKIRKLLTWPQKKKVFSVGNVWDSTKFGAMCFRLNTYTLEMFQEWIVQDLRLCYTRVGGEVLDEQVEIPGIRDADHMRTIFKRLQAFAQSCEAKVLKRFGAKEVAQQNAFIFEAEDSLDPLSNQLSNNTQSRPHRVAGPHRVAVFHMQIPQTCCSGDLLKIKSSTVMQLIS